MTLDLILFSQHFLSSHPLISLLFKNVMDMGDDVEKRCDKNAVSGTEFAAFDEHIDETCAKNKFFEKRGPE